MFLDALSRPGRGAFHKRGLLLVSTGSKNGYHLRAFTTPTHIKKARRILLEKIVMPLWKQKDIRGYLLDPRRAKMPVGFKKKSGEILIDLSPMHARGCIKAIGTVNRLTSALVKTIPIEHLWDFFPEFNKICRCA